MPREKKSSAVGGGVSVSSLLGLIFVTLKLCGVINWSWWVVLMPFYLPIVVGLAIAAFCLLIAGGFKLCGW